MSSKDNLSNLSSYEVVDALIQSQHPLINFISEHAVYTSVSHLKVKDRDNMLVKLLSVAIGLSGTNNL